MIRRRAFLSLAICCASLVGCGGGDSYPLAPVSGTITLDGKPLPDAKVGFEPMRVGNQLDAGPGSYAKTDANGKYTLKSLNGDEGAVVGEHRVWVRTIKAKGDESGRVIVEREELLPARYHDETQLTFTVPPGGSTTADFALDSK